MQTSEIKQRLEKLAPSVLADALIKLSDRDKTAEALVKQLISTPEESEAIFKRKLSGIKRRKKFIFRSGSRVLSSELEDLIKLTTGDAIPPEAALNCLVSFFESDTQIMNMCDDSNGDIGGVFLYNATRGFVKKANQLSEQSTLLQMTKKLMKENDYGVRDRLFESIAEYLDAPSVRRLYDHLEKTLAELKKSEDATDCNVSSLKYRIQTIAKQLNDPEVFESVCKDGAPKVPDYKMVAVAEAYYSAGKPELALEKLNSVKTIHFNFIQQHEELLLKIHASMGNNDKIQALKIQAFFESPSRLTYQSMCEVVDEAKTTKLLAQCLNEAETSNDLHTSTVNFLLDLQQYDRASQYLISRHDQIDGSSYYTYPEIACSLSAEGHPLAATLIFRALLISLLERAMTKSYTHGATYLKTLSELAHQITDWESHPTHEEFFQSVKENHARKSSFWKRVRENY